MEINKKILASVFIIGILALALGWGTYSWFSDTETSTENVFTAGTLDIKLSGGEPSNDGVTGTWTASDWAPGETKTATLTVTNDGSIGAFYFYFGISSLTDGLSSQIFVTEFIVPEVSGDYNHIGWMATTWGPWVIVDDGILTLEEFGKWAGTDSPYGFMAWGENDDPQAKSVIPTSTKILPAGGSLTVTMTLLFNPEAGNDYQGGSCSFDVTVAAWNGPAAAVTVISGGSGLYGYGN